MGERRTHFPEEISLFFVHVEFSGERMRFDEKIDDEQNLIVGHQRKDSGVRFLVVRRGEINRIIVAERRVGQRLKRAERLSESCAKNQRDDEIDRSAERFSTSDGVRLEEEGYTRSMQRDRSARSEEIPERDGSSANRPFCCSTDRRRGCQSFGSVPFEREIDA